MEIIEDANGNSGTYHAAAKSPAKHDAAKGQESQAVDLCNLFAGIWMEEADDMDTAGKPHHSNVFFLSLASCFCEGAMIDDDINCTPVQMRQAGVQEVSIS